MTSFVTEFGHEIPFVPQYFERNKGYAYYTKGTKLHEGLDVLKGDILPATAAAKDWVQFSSMYHFMERYGLLKPRRTGIDLGGAEGTIIRFLKASGFIEHATNLDIDDYTNIAGDDYFRLFVEILGQIDSGTGSSFDNIRESINQAKFAFDHFPGTPVTTGMRTKLPGSTDLDQFLHKDVLDATGTYDFVTSSFCFDYLDLDSALPKVRNLLKDDGLFIGFFEYWWWPVNSTGILGHFPYAGQRLSFADLERYYDQHHPDLINNLYFKYYYFHEGKQHPTIDDWFDLARRYDLRPIAAERIIPLRHKRLPDCPPQIFQHPWFDHREVLRDIHHLKPGVTVDDLFTSAFRVAMVPA